MAKEGTEDYDFLITAAEVTIESTDSDETTVEELIDAAQWYLVNKSMDDYKPKDIKEDHSDYVKKWHPDFKDSPGTSDKVGNEERNVEAMYKRHFIKALHDYKIGKFESDAAAFDWFYNQVHPSKMPMEENSLNGVKDIVKVQGGTYEISGDYDVDEVNMNIESIKKLLLWYNFYAAYIGDLGQRQEANEKNREIADQLELYGITDFRIYGS